MKWHNRTYDDRDDNDTKKIGISRIGLRYCDCCHTLLHKWYTIAEQTVLQSRCLSDRGDEVVHVNDVQDEEIKRTLCPLCMEEIRGVIGTTEPILEYVKKESGDKPGIPFIIEMPFLSQDNLIIKYIPFVITDLKIIKEGNFEANLIR